MPGAGRKVEDSELLEALLALQDFRRGPPTYRELGDLVGLTVNAVVERLYRLEDRGLVDLGAPGQPRQLRLTAAGRDAALADVREVPLVLSFRPPWEARRVA